uniref:Chitin-binding type-2 domain-containing protein n=1 Tax=Trichuris muris TaxID=70415 RepID=A0A5S6R1B7_TRIMR
MYRQSPIQYEKQAYSRISVGLSMPFQLVKATRFHECDAGRDVPLKVNATVYLLCHKPPEIIGKAYRSNGIWFRWKCEKEGPFDFASCMPELDDIYEELKHLMHDLVFCDEEDWIVRNEEQKAKHQPSCEVQKAPLIPDAHDDTHFYQCELDSPGDKCGHWRAHTCDEGQIFNSTLEKCISGTHAPSDESRMGTFASPFAPYGAYPYPAAYDYAYPSAYYGYPVAPGVVPMQSPVLPVPLPASVPMQTLEQYYMSMYPWMFPNVMGKPFVPGAGGVQTQGGGIGQAPIGGGGQAPIGGGGQAPSGGGGQTPSAGGGGSQSGGAGGALPGTGKIPGLNKLPGLGGGGGSGSGKPSVPGLGKLPSIGGVVKPSDLGLNQLPGIG